MNKGTIEKCRLVASGFSLVELIVASAIIAMVGAGTLAAISFFESTTANSSNEKASKNLLTNVIDQAHSSFTEDVTDFDATFNDAALTASSRNTSASSWVNPILGDEDRFDDQSPNCAIESADLTNKTFTLDSDCPDSVFSDFSFLNSSTDPAPIHIIGGSSICAVNRVTASTNTFHLCPDSDGCDDSVATTECIPFDGDNLIVGSEVLIPRYVIRDSDSADSGEPVAYLVESAGVVGPNQITLEVDDQYYTSFDNDEFDATCTNGTCTCDIGDDTGVSCSVPVQENSARNINPDGLIRVSSDSLSAYTQDITIIVTATNADDSSVPALGSLAVSTGAGFIADSDDNASVLRLEGSLLALNDTLETLSYTGNSGVFEDVSVKVQMQFGSLEQSTGSGADNVANDIQLQVFPNCGCEPEGRTAVTFRLGKWLDDSSQFADQSSYGLPMDITSIVLQSDDTPETFYGYGQECIGMSVSGPCVGSTKQQTIAEDDTISLFLYEYTGSEADASDKFSMFFFDDAYNNDCVFGESDNPDPATFWDGISTGRGTWDEAINGTTKTPKQWACYAKIKMQNIPERTSDGPFINVEGESGDFVTTSEYTGNSLPNTDAIWGRINTTANGGRSDGFIMTLPVDTASSGLDTYTTNGNPRFIISEYNSLQSWRIRKVRYPTDYDGDSCPATLTAEEEDAIAWLDNSSTFTNAEKVAIPQHLWDTSLDRSTKSAIWNNSTNAIELRVQTAKTCPDPNLFVD